MIGPGAGGRGAAGAGAGGAAGARGGGRGRGGPGTRGGSGLGSGAHHGGGGGRPRRLPTAPGAAKPLEQFHLQLHELAERPAAFSARWAQEALQEGERQGGDAAAVPAPVPAAAEPRRCCTCRHPAAAARATRALLHAVRPLHGALRFSCWRARPSRVSWWAAAAVSAADPQLRAARLLAATDLRRALTPHLCCARCLPADHEVLRVRHICRPPVSRCRRSSSRRTRAPVPNALLYGGACPPPCKKELAASLALGLELGAVCVCTTVLRQVQGAAGARALQQPKRRLHPVPRLPPHVPAAQVRGALAQGSGKPDLPQGFDSANWRAYILLSQDYTGKEEQASRPLSGRRQGEV